MKTRSILLGIASLAAGLSSALAQTAVTDPVGYITHTINPSVSASVPSITLLSPTLVNKTDFAGATTSASGSTTVTASGIPAGLDSSSYLEIKSGSNEGWWTTIVSSTAGSLVTTDAIPTGSDAGTSIIVRKHMTLGGFMGANGAGLTTGTGPDVADEVQILDSHLVPQAVRTYFYASAQDGGPGWFDPGATPSDNVILLPGTSVQIVRKSTSGLSLVSVGHVKTTKTQIDIFPGANWVNPMRATGVSLGSSGFDTGALSTGVLRGTSTADADEVQFVLAPSAGVQALSSFFAADPLQAGVTGWFDPGAAPSDTVVISESQGVILSRKSATPAVITVPAVTISTTP